MDTRTDLIDIDDISLILDIASELTDEVEALHYPPWLMTWEGFCSEILRRYNRYVSEPPEVKQNKELRN